MNAAKIAIAAVVCAAVPFAPVPAETGDALYERNKALSREAVELRKRVKELEDECARLAKTVRVLDTTRDMMLPRERRPQ